MSAEGLLVLVLVLVLVLLVLLLLVLLLLLLLLRCDAHDNDIKPFFNTQHRPPQTQSQRCVWQALDEQHTRINRFNLVAINGENAITGADLKRVTRCDRVKVKWSGGGQAAAA